MNWRVSPVAGLHQNQMFSARVFFEIFYFFIIIQLFNCFLIVRLKAL